MAIQQMDLDLISRWFFVDPKIANPATLNAMIDDLGILPDKSYALTNGWIGIRTLVDPLLFPLFATAVLLMLMLPSKKLMVAWILCLAAFFTLGVLGRPGIHRVYIPVLSLLLIAPLLTAQAMQGVLRWRLVKSVILIATLINTAAIFSESRAARALSEQIRYELQDFPNDMVVIWGGVFPYEAVYPVLKQSVSAMNYRHYGLGTTTLAPFSNAYAETYAGRGMVERLISPDGVPIVARDTEFYMLSKYCSEHFNGILQELARDDYGQVIIRRSRCHSLAVE